MEGTTKLDNVSSSKDDIKSKMAVVAESRVSGLIYQFQPQLAQPMSIGAHDEEGSACMWKALTSIAFLGVGVSMLNVFLTWHHAQEAEIIAYPHLCIRSKSFPWGAGNHILFHNPHTNALLIGYEDK